MVSCVEYETKGEKTEREKLCPVFLLANAIWKNTESDFFCSKRCAWYYRGDCAIRQIADRLDLLFEQTKWR